MEWAPETIIAGPKRGCTRRRSSRPKLSASRHLSISIFSHRSLHDLLLIKLQRHEKAFRTKAVMIRKPERKREREKRRPGGEVVPVEPR